MKQLKINNNFIIRGWNNQGLEPKSFPNHFVLNRTTIYFVPFHCSDQQNKVLNRFESQKSTSLYRSFLFLF